MPYNAHLYDILYKKVIYITYSALYSTNFKQNKMENKTAVKWLYQELIKKSVNDPTHNVLNILEQALEMEAKQQQLDLTNITRLEVINHASNSHPIGRVLTMYKETEDFTVVDAEFQDGHRTLKIFIS